MSGEEEYEEEEGEEGEEDDEEEEMEEEEEAEYEDDGYAEPTEGELQSDEETPGPSPSHDDQPLPSSMPVDLVQAGDEVEQVTASVDEGPTGSEGTTAGVAIGDSSQGGNTSASGATFSVSLCACHFS